LYKIETPFLRSLRVPILLKDKSFADQYIFAVTNYIFAFVFLKAFSKKRVCYISHAHFF